MPSSEADGKIITRKSSSEFVFIDLRAYRLQNFFFGEAEAPFLQQLKTLQLFLFMDGESSWSTQRLAFYPSQYFHVFKLCSFSYLIKLCSSISCHPATFTFSTAMFKSSFE